MFLDTKEKENLVVFLIDMILPRSKEIVNHADEVGPGIIKVTTDNKNKIAELIINQLIPQDGNEIDSIFPKVLRGAIEDVYQTPFRLLGNFGKNQFNKLKQKTLKQ